MNKQQILKLIEEVESMFPYRVSGRHDTYCEYNQGWTGACAAIESLIESLEDEA